MLARESLGLPEVAVAIEQAVAAVIRDGARTADLLPAGDSHVVARASGLTLVGTREAADLIVAQLLGA
jgi:hypothetical protein